MFVTILGASADTMNGLQAGFSQIGLPIILLVGLALVMIVPQRRQQKKVKAMMDGIKVGDHIRTIGGFYGKIVQVKEDIVMIEVGPDKVRLPITKGAIATVENVDVENENSVSTDK